MDNPPTSPQRPGHYGCVSVKILRNSKVKRLTHPAQIALYIASILHCAEELTDGYIAPEHLPELCLNAQANPRRDPQQLVAQNLWKPSKHGGYTLPDYLEWNPSRAWWEHKRDQARERKRRQRQAPDVTAAVTRDNPRPVTRESHDIEVEVDLRASNSSTSTADPPISDRDDDPAQLAAAGSRPATDADRGGVYDARMASREHTFGTVGDEAASIVDKLRAAIEGAA